MGAISQEPSPSPFLLLLQYAQYFTADISQKYF